MTARRSNHVASRMVALVGLVLAAAGCGGAEDPDGGRRPDGGHAGDGGHSGDGGGGGGDGGQGGDGFVAIALPYEGERVTGIYCASDTQCVVSTHHTTQDAHIYATDGHTITRTLVTGDADLAETFDIIGIPTFTGFSRIGDRLVAHVRGAANGFVSATGDLRVAANWTATRVGPRQLEQQLGFGTNGTSWITFVTGTVYESPSMPALGVGRTAIWDPQASPTVPPDLAQRRQNDPTICNTTPGITGVMLQGAYVAPNTILIVYPADEQSQNGNDAPGVCISVDHGRTFRHAAFSGVAANHGPRGVTCISNDDCFAVGGLPFAAGSTYVFVSHDASLGSASTWTRATTPTFDTDTLLTYTFFAPDGEHGFIVGEQDRGPYLLATEDGGDTWTDATDLVRDVTDQILTSGFALDEERVFLGGNGDTLLVRGF